MTCSLEVRGMILSGGKGEDYFNCGLGKDKVVDLNAAEGDGESYNCEGQ
jgi:hypothetical protein